MSPSSSKLISGGKSRAAKASMQPPRVKEVDPVQRVAHDAERRAIMRDSMIAEAAYYLAERRGFAPGCELDDWLAAEQELERLPLAS